MDKTTVILGPFDVALEEPVYFKIEPNDDARTIKSVDMVNGFVHRGIESIVLQKNFLQNLIITEKCVRFAPTTILLPTVWQWKKSRVSTFRCAHNTFAF